MQRNDISWLTHATIKHNFGHFFLATGELNWPQMSCTLASNQHGSFIVTKIVNYEIQI
jgi:hypothetical protein